MFSKLFGVRRRRVGFTLIELLVVIAIIAILIALLLPAVQKVRMAAARMQGTNNLKQCGIGVHAFHDSFQRLPYNGCQATVPSLENACSSNVESGSWTFQILPYIEQNSYYNAMDNVNGDNGSALSSMFIKTYICPGRGRPGYKSTGGSHGAVTDYALNLWLNQPSGGNRDVVDAHLGLMSITDGTSNTILAGEKQIRTGQYTNNNTDGGDDAIWCGGWEGDGRGGSTLVVDPTGGSEDDNGWGSPFAGSSPFLLCDGSVHLIGYGIDPTPGLKPTDGLNCP